MYDALESKFEADRAKSIATLRISFEKPVAVGEHPTLLDDMAKLITELATAEESLAALRDNFGDKMEEPSETPDAPWAGEVGGGKLKE
jgi:methylaspartate ammonia-lyase